MASMNGGHSEKELGRNLSSGLLKVLQSRDERFFEDV
jgi:hypothetical protein